MNKTKIMQLIIIIFMFSLINLPAVLADGMVLPPWGPPIPEHQQLALINWQDGREHLLLSIQTDATDEKAAWIVPIPSSPDQTVINILPDFPRIYGYDIKQEARNELDGLFYRIQGTQIYPIFFFPRYYWGRPGIPGILAPEIMAGKEYEGITVHEHIEKEGVITELITAEDGKAFYDYLMDQGINISKEGIPVLKHYIGKDYTFVVSWLSPEEQEEEREDIGPYYRRRRPAIFVSFPTKKPFYPLIPTSIYGSKEVPTTVYLNGLYKPKIFNNIKPYTETSYLKQEYYMHLFTEEDTEELNKLLPQRENIVFTRIDLNAPSKLLTEDLYFEQGAPASIHLSLCIITALRKARWPTFFFFAAIISAITGLLAGLIAFRKIKKGKFALLGLANCASIVGLVIAIIFTRTRTISPELRKKLKQEKITVITADRRKIWFVITFTIIFVIITGILRVVF